MRPRQRRHGPAGPAGGPRRHRPGRPGRLRPRPADRPDRGGPRGAAGGRAGGPVRGRGPGGGGAIGRGGPTGGQQGLRQGVHGPARHPHRPLRGAPPGGLRPGEPHRRPIPLPRGDQGRRPGRRQGRGHRPESGRGPPGAGRDDGGTHLRRGRRPGRPGRVPHRRRGLGHRAVGRRAYPAPTPVPGPQAGLRRRPWAQHRRDGRLLRRPHPGAGGDGPGTSPRPSSCPLSAAWPRRGTPSAACSMPA